MIRLALLRHGHTDWNRAGRIQGRTDIELDEEAREEHAALALPASWAQADLVSSPLARARQTAELVAGRTPTPVPELIEMDWGRWEGARGEDLIADPESGYRHIEHWGWAFAPPEGESLGDLRDRLAPWVAGLSRDTVAVCHIGIMRVLLAQAYDWGFEGTPPFQVKRRRLYPLLIEDGQIVGVDPIERLPGRDATS